MMQSHVGEMRLRKLGKYQRLARKPFMEHLNLTIEGMTCIRRAKRVQVALRRITGVVKVTETLGA